MNLSSKTNIMRVLNEQNFYEICHEIWNTKEPGNMKFEWNLSDKFEISLWFFLVTDPSVCAALAHSISLTWDLTRLEETGKRNSTWLRKVSLHRCHLHLLLTAAHSAELAQCNHAIDYWRLRICIKNRDYRLLIITKDYTGITGKAY